MKKVSKIIVVLALSSCVYYCMKFMVFESGYQETHLRVIESIIISGLILIISNKLGAVKFKN